MNSRTLCVLPLFEDRTYFYSMLYLIKEKNFRKHILVLLPEGEHSEVEDIKKLLAKTDFSIMHVNYRSASHRAKIALELAFEWHIDYVAVFNEACEDGIEDFLDFIASADKENFSLISNARRPKDLSLGTVLSYTLSVIYSLFLRRTVSDLSGDSSYALRTRDFVHKFQSSGYLPDDESFFAHLLLYSRFRNFSFIYLKTKSLVRKSFFKYNLANFFLLAGKSLSYLLVGSSVMKIRSSIKRHIPETFPLHGTEEKKEETKNAPKLKVNSEEKGESFLSLKEAASMKKDAVKLLHKDEKHSKQLIVNWCLTNICNYKCSYCPDMLHNGTAKGVDLETAKSFVDKVGKHYTDKEIHFELTGGEVTYYKGFSDLIQYIKSQGHYVAIISNGARKIDFWEKHVEFLDHIMLSFHSEQGGPEHFKDVVNFLGTKTSVHVNVMMKPENFDLCYNLAQAILQDIDVSIALQPLLEGMDGKMFDYTPEQKDILDNQTLTRNSQAKTPKDSYHSRGELELHFKDGKRLLTNSPELIANDFHHWAGWNCNIGLETICVDLTGRLLRGWCAVGGIFGSIHDYKIRFPKTSILCNKSQCSCGQDIMTTKIKNA